ncbi:MAG: polyprenyl synthetase family protein [Deltaproteobacteria bacterium]|nr:polyprenyl synthetase family protein [Deltaproteobacteria bacterium]MCL5792459.1 polyprenyl synthetase family protein [Deltaproteobacteria bacterium]
MSSADSVTKDLKVVNSYIKAVTMNSIPEIPVISQHLIGSGGKRIRPYLVIMSSRMFNVPKKDYVKVAAAVELYHSASLLHDDVVDNAKQRRGIPSANHVWGNKNSVLVGDFLLARTSSIIANMRNHDLLELFVDVLGHMAEGELIQMQLSHKPDLTEDDYFSIVKKKTAHLISASCESGAIVGNAGQQFRKVLRRYGLLIGMAFQLIDDNIDYTSMSKVSGKDKWADIKEGKVTLPMTVALLRATNKEKAFLKRVIIEKKGKFEDYPKVHEIIKKYKGFDYTKNKAEDFADKALQYLNTLPPSLELDEMRKFTHSVVDRKY